MFCFHHQLQAFCESLSLWLPCVPSRTCPMSCSDRFALRGFLALLAPGRGLGWCSVILTQPLLRWAVALWPRGGAFPPPGEVSLFPSPSGQPWVFTCTFEAKRLAAQLVSGFCSAEKRSHGASSVPTAAATPPLQALPLVFLRGPCGGLERSQ